MTNEDQKAIEDLRNAAIALAQAIIADADSLIDELPAGDLIAALNEGCDHEWDEIVGNHPDYKYYRCTKCRLQRSVNRLSGLATFWRP